MYGDSPSFFTVDRKTMPLKGNENADEMSKESSLLCVNPAVFDFGICIETFTISNITF